MSPMLAITRGLPSAGKTTQARAWVLDASEGERRARVNRDDLRAALFAGEGVLPWPQEQAITTAQHAMVRALLADGVSVVVDDLNLRAKYATAWADLADEMGAQFEVWDRTFVPVDECVARDLARASRGERSVGEDAIRGIHARYLAAGPLAPVRCSQPRQRTAPARYVPDPALPEVWICDLDGTAALGHFGEPGRRGPFDWARVGEDDPNMPVIAVLHALARSGAGVIFTSGRSDVCREETAEWLDDLGFIVDTNSLFMRRDGDGRPDHVVKAEMFDKYIRHRFHVRGVLDDRDSVVAMWRAMGLMCAQVGEGSF